MSVNQVGYCWGKITYDVSTSRAEAVMHGRGWEKRASIVGGPEEGMRGDNRVGGRITLCEAKMSPVMSS